MGVCGKACRYCKQRITGTYVAPVEDPIEKHTHKCAVDTAKNKVLLAFVEYLKLENGKELIDELKEIIMSAS